jgi:hypothetical protein
LAGGEVSQGELGVAAIYAVAALYVLDAYFPPKVG